MEKIFSVIVPVYNVEKYLDRCMNSIIKQIDDKIEIILVDDGSKDSSGDMCDRYAEKYADVKVIHQQNQGLSAARNTGIEHASGKYIYFIDSDDMIADGFFEDISSILCEYKDADIIEFKYCDEMTPGIYELIGTKKCTVVAKNTYIDELVKLKIENQICFRLYKTSLFNDIRFPIGRHFEDIAVFCKIALKSNKIIRTDYTYYIYNKTNPDSITRKTDMKTMNDLYKSENDFYEALKPYYIENALDMDYLEYKRLRMYIYICYMLYKSKRTDNELYRKLKKFLKNQKSIKLSKYKYFGWKRMILVMTLLKLDIM